MAIRDFFKNIGQGYQRGLTEMGGYDPMQQVSPEEAERRRQEGMQALQRSLGRATAILSGDPRRMQLAEQQTQRAEQEREQAERQKSLEALAQTNPELAKMYELFGERGLQQGYLRQQELEEGAITSQQQIQRLKGAGFTEQEINLILAGVTPKDVMDLRQKDMSGTQIIESVEQNIEKTAKETGVLDTFADLDQAFGPVDALQEGISKATRIAGFDIDPKTGAAVRARNSLNTEILANLAADFTGKPNMLIYENIKGNLPMSAATSHADAREKYENIKDQVDARINGLKEGLNSSILNDATKNAYRDELNKSILLSKKLDAAILSLKGKKEETLKPEQFVSEGKYSSLFLNKDSGL
jgi:hypothetical protein